MNPADADLETAIDLAALRLWTAGTYKERVKAWDELTALHAKRSEDRVREMEREQGLMPENAE